jgi:hypothetical protein
MYEQNPGMSVTGYQLYEYAEGYIKDLAWLAELAAFGK